MAGERSPSLSEITSIRGDANIGLAESGGNDVVLAPNTSELTYLAAANQTRNAANQFLAKQHQDNLQAALKNFNATDVTGVYTPDYDTITNDYRTLTKDIYDNYDVLSNPMKNPQMYSQLMQRQASLDAKIAKSKQFSLLDSENIKFLEAHPEFNTPENINALKAYRSAPIDTRKPFTLTPPKPLNYAAVLKSAADLTKQKMASSNIAGGYIKNTDKELYNPEKWRTNYKAILKGSNGFGGTWEDALKAEYDNIPEDLNGVPKQSFDQFINQQADNARPLDEVTNSSIAADPYALNSQQFANQVKLAGINNEFAKARAKTDHDYDLELAKLKGEIQTEKSVTKTGEFLNNMVANLFNGTNDVVSTIQLDGVSKQRGINPTPLYRDAFGYEISQPGAKSYKEYPDSFTKDADGNLNVYWYEKDGEKPIKVGNGYKIKRREKYNPNQAREQLANTLLTSAQKGKALEAAQETVPDLNDPEALSKYGNNNIKQPKPSNSSEKTKTVYRAEYNGGIITSPDGKNWIDSDGNPVK